MFGVDSREIEGEFDEDGNEDNKGDGDGEFDDDWSEGEFDGDGNEDNNSEGDDFFLLILCGVTHPALLGAGAVVVAASSAPDKLTNLEFIECQIHE